MKHIKKFNNLNEGLEDIDEYREEIESIEIENEKLPIVKKTIKSIKKGEIKKVNTDRNRILLNNGDVVQVYDSETTEPGGDEGEVYNNYDSIDIQIMTINGKYIGKFGYITIDTYWKILDIIRKFSDF